MIIISCSLLFFLEISPSLVPFQDAVSQVKVSLRGGKFVGTAAAVTDNWELHGRLDLQMVKDFW